MRNKLHENKNDPKKFWRQINHEILGKRNNDGIRVIQKREGEYLTGKQAADYINRVYAEMGRNEDGHTAKWSAESMNMDFVKQIFDFKFIELLEIHQLVKGIDITKSSGIEGLSSRLLKDCFTICEYELSYLFNCSIQTMSFPTK